jgi:3-hydroxybutyryl-CoA dehydrogenase
MPMEVKSIAVIGADAAGPSIARMAILAGYRTILEDVSDARLKNAMDWIAQSLEQDVANGRIEGNAREAALEKLSTAHTVEDAIRDVDLIIETLPEDMEMKLELFTILDKFAKPKAIFASAGQISITELAEITFCSNHCIGMRFMPNAVDAQIIELVKGSDTSPEIVAECSDVARRMGKSVIAVEESFAGVPDERYRKVAKTRHL